MEDEENFLLSEEWKQLCRKFPLVAEMIAEAHASSVDFGQYVEDMRQTKNRLDGLQKQVDDINSMLTRLGIQRIAAHS